MYVQQHPHTYFFGWNIRRCFNNLLLIFGIGNLFFLFCKPKPILFFGLNVCKYYQRKKSIQQMCYLLCGQFSSVDVSRRRGSIRRWRYRVAPSHHIRIYGFNLIFLLVTIRSNYVCVVFIHHFAIVGSVGYCVNLQIINLCERGLHRDDKRTM